MELSKQDVRKYWFGLDDERAIGETVLLMERNRLEQYQAALDSTELRFNGVFSGITGYYKQQRISVVYSIGPAHVADCVNFLAHGFHPKRFVATGSIGGLHAEMGDVIISNSCSTQDGYSISLYHETMQSDPMLGVWVDVSHPGTWDLSLSVREHISSVFGCQILSGEIFTVPAVSLEDVESLKGIEKRGYIAIDLETGPFLSACKHNQVEGICIHWVTDLPLTRNFYYQYSGDTELIEKDRVKKHRQWLNMPRLILPILSEIMV